MKHKLLIFLVAISFTVLGTTRVFAQCDAATMTITPTVTPNSCGDNGSITVATNAVNAQYTLTAVVGSFVAGPQSSNTFQNLAPGDYSLTVECAAGGDNTIQVTVGNTHVPISNADVTSTSACSASSFNGSFSINSVTGGTAPFQISAIINSNPDYDDSISNYAITTSSFPITVPVTTSGTYQIRIKDACGTYYTITQTMQSSSPKVTGVWWGAKKTTCGTGTVPLTFTGFSFSSQSGTLALSDVYGKIRMTVYEMTGTTVCSDPNTAPSTTPVFDAILQDPGTTTQSYNMVPSHKYFVVFTNECGEQTSTCFDNTSAETTQAAVIAKSSGCAGASGGIIFEGTQLSFMNYPVHVTFLDSSGNALPTQPQIEYIDNNGNNWNLVGNNLNADWEGSGWQSKTTVPYGNYIIRYTDNCGINVDVPVSNPLIGLGTTPITITDRDFWSKWRCFGTTPLNQQGTAQIGLAFGGPIQDFHNLTVKIVSPSPSHIGDIAAYQDNHFFFTNLLPGTYTVELSSASNCGGYPVLLTFPVNNNSSELLTQTINSWGESFCSGGGNIRSTVASNAGYPTTVELLNSAGAVIASDGSGNFYNVAAGTYRTRIKTTPGCGSPYYVDGQEVVITSNTSGPRIIRRNGIICDPPSSTGSLYVELAGPLPITFRYRVSGTATWTTVTVTDLSQPLIISGLLANTSYDLLASSCGKTTTSSVYMATANPIAIDNTRQPCPGQPYLLSVRKFAGATYSWTFNGTPYGGNTNSLTFSPYAASNDGTYTVTVNWGGCAVRTYTFTLDSSQCGNSFGTGNITGNVFNDTTNDGTVNGVGINNPQNVPLYMTAVPLDGSSPVTVAVNANGTYLLTNLPTGSYNLVLSTNPAGSTTPNLPSEWSNVGEHVGTGAGTDGNPNGLLTVTFGVGQNVSNANFGIAKTVCYKTDQSTGTALDTNHGITSLGRAGTDNGGWPMIRKGAWTVLESKTKAFVINRLSNDQIQSIATPVDGMMVYDTDAKCLKIFVENADPTLNGWHCFNKQGCPDN